MNISSQKKPALIKSFSGKFVLTWLTGMIFAYFLTGFFFNFYPSIFQFILLSIILQLLCGTIVPILLDDALNNLQANWQKNWATIPTIILALFFAISTVTVSWQYPSLFNRRILFMDLSVLPLFIGLSFVSMPGTLVFLKALKRYNMYDSLNQSPAFIRLRDNLPGVFLALIFFFSYFALVESINFPNFPTMDQYFDLDISAWLERLVTPERQDVIAVRAVHPAILVFLRPLIWFVSSFLNGNRLHSVFLVNALAGAACVLVFWLIVKQLTKNTVYALSMASILGASTAHLLFSSMLETYIYSALALIIFVLVIQGEKKTLAHTVPVGILVFGITITNLAQTCILYFLALPSIKTIFKYIFLVLIATALLNILQVWVYPNAKSFLLPSNLLVEQHYRFELTRASWQVTGRIFLIARAILLYGIVAPTPFILTKELGAIVPNFRTFEVVVEGFHASGYSGIADITAKFWILIVAIAGILFLRELFKTPKQMLFPISLLLCLGFNFVLHITYGDDPMLYSPDWVYALVLFVAFAFRKYADQKWIHILMLIFLGLLINTNLKLIQQIMEVSLPFYG